MRPPVKRIHKAAQAALLALFFQASSAYCDWSNFGTISMTDPVTPKLTSGYGCYTDGRDIVCDSKSSAVNFGTGGLITTGGMTVGGSISASAVSATYVSATVLQINPSAMPCSTGLNGTIRYSSTSNTLEVCAGTTWSTLSSNTTPGNITGTGSATAVAFWNGPNSLTYESGTTALYWDHNTARLGVGTNTPTYGIDSVNSALGGYSIIRTYHAGGNSAFWAQNGSGTTAIMQAYNGVGFVGTSSYSPVGLITSNTVRAYITGAGNVGIGTQAPTAALQVSGTFTVSNSAQGATSPSLFVDSAGNVIIGSTTTPLGKLHVGGYVSLRDNAGGDARLLAFSGDGSIATELFAFNGLGGYVGTYSNNPFWIRTNDTNRMSFTTSGSIGVGTANPGSSLTIVGEVQTGSSGAACVTTTNGGAIRYSAGTLYYCNGANTWSTISDGGAGFTGGGSATAIAFWNGPNSLTYESATTSGLYWDHANGRLGVGFNAPGVPLDVAGVIYARGTSNTGAVAIINPDPTSGANGVAIESSFVSGGYGPLVFRTTAAERMRIMNGSGNVGIGTSLPAATLQVSGTFTVSNSAQSTTPTLFVGAGSVGIGTSSPAQKLHVYTAGANYATARVGNGASSVDLALAPDGTAQLTQNGFFDLTFGTGAVERLRIVSSGNVGIGTTSPGSSLTIVGEAQVGNSGAACVTVTNGGAIRYSAGTLYYCNGANTWTTLANGGAGGALTGTGSATAIAFWNGPNSLTYESATTSGLYWDHTNGFLGVGNNIPAANLSVSGTAQLMPFGGGSPTMLIRGVANYAGVNNVLQFRQSTATAGGMAFSFYDYDPAIFMRVGTGTTTNVGIQTSSPTATLQVSGTFTVSNSGQPFDSPSLVVTSGGNVGIGTNLPNTPLEVASSSQAGLTAPLTLTNKYLDANTEVALRLAPSNAPNSRYAAVSAFNSGSNNIGLKFYTYRSGFIERAQIDNLGNMGISTTTPQTKLDVNGEIRISNTSLACVTSTTSGALRYVSGTGVQYCNGASTWTSLGGGGGGTLNGGGSATAVAFWNGASSLTYESTTTSGLYWDTDNKRLGIGTNSPSAAIDVSNSSGFMWIRKGTGGGLPSSAGAGLKLESSANGAYIQGYDYGAGGATSLLLNTSGGSVGVGVTTPTATLQVSGTFTVSQSGQTSTPSLYVSGTTGYVGVGTNAPAYWLQVKSANAAVNPFVASENDTGTISVFGTARTGNPSWSGKTIIQNMANNDFVFWGGRVGINISSPTAALQVSGTFTVSTSAQTATPSLYVGADGKVGVGGFPSTTLHSYVGTGTNSLRVQSGNGIVDLSHDGTNTFLTNYSSGGAINYSASGVGAYHAFWVSGTERVRITSGGNVGIGTASPGSSLTVVGEVQVSNSGAVCAANTNGGALRYVSGTGMQYCNGSNAWTGIGAGGGTLTGGGSATAVAFWNGASALTYDSSTNGGLYWDNTNKRLGIGTNAPTSALYVSGSGDVRATVDSSDATYGAYTGYQLNGSGSFKGGLFLNNGQKSKVGLWNGTAQVVTVDSSGNVGIGMQSPTATFQVSGTFTVSNTISPSAPALYVDGLGNVGVGTSQPSASVHVSGPVGAVYVDTYSASQQTASAFLARRARGTATTPSAVLANDWISVFGARGYGATGYTTASRANLTMGADENWTDTAQGTFVAFKTTANGTLNTSETMRITNAGYVGIGTSTPASMLQVSGTAMMNMATLVSQSTASLTGPGGNQIVSGTSSVSVMKDGTVTITVAGAVRATAEATNWKFTAGAASGGLYGMSQNGSAYGVLGYNNAWGVLCNGTNCGGTQAWNNYSDGRLKERVKDLPTSAGLAVVMKLRPVTFHWRDVNQDKAKGEQLGFIAQDVQKVLPQVLGDPVDSSITLADGKVVSIPNTLNLSYATLVVPLVKSIQELKADNDNLRTQIKTANDNAAFLRSQLDAVNGRLQMLETEIKKK